MEAEDEAREGWFPRPRGAAPHGPGGVPKRWSHATGTWEPAADGEPAAGPRPPRPKAIDTAKEPAAESGESSPVKRRAASPAKGSLVLGGLGPKPSAAVQPERKLRAPAAEEPATTSMSDSDLPGW